MLVEHWVGTYAVTKTSPVHLRRREVCQDRCVCHGRERISTPRSGNKRHLEIMDPIPQLIAAALAAVQFNNRTQDLLGLDPLVVKVMAGITMTGTCPTFFKILVTLELIEAVQRGEYPARPTVVVMHRLEVPRPSRRLHEGMRPMDNRRCILAHFEALKEFIN